MRHHGPHVVIQRRPRPSSGGSADNVGMPLPSGSIRIDAELISSKYVRALVDRHLIDLVCTVDGGFLLYDRPCITSRVSQHPGSAQWIRTSASTSMHYGLLALKPLLKKQASATCTELEEGELSKPGWACRPGPRLRRHAQSALPPLAWRQGLVRFPFEVKRFFIRLARGASASPEPPIACSRGPCLGATRSAARSCPAPSNPEDGD